MTGTRSIFLYILIALAGLSACSGEPREETVSTYSGAYPVELPKFLDRDYPITDFGAINDGVSLNTGPINDAIDACSKSGGGRVIIPGGIWISGPIRLKSNVNLHIESGAVVLFSSNFDLYPYIQTYFEGRRDYRATPMLYGDSLENIAITGGGIFDGSGDAWRQVKKMKTTGRQWAALLASGGVLNERDDTWWPNEFAYEASLDPAGLREVLWELPDRDKYKAFYRPALVQLISCNRILLEGPVFQNSPGWCIHPLMCTNLTVNNIKVKNPWYAQNGDGIDVESCTYVSIRNSFFDVGDDAICIKSGRDEEGRKRGMPTQYVEVDNCVVHNGHGGFVVGSEMSGGVKDIRVSNCSFIGTDVGLRFKSNRGRGGVVENIHIENIRMVNIARDAIIFNLFYANQAPTEMTEQPLEQLMAHAPEVSVETPEFRNITISGINCQGAVRPLQVMGLPEMPVSGLSITNSVFSTSRGISCLFAKRLTISDVTILTQDHPTLLINNVQEAEINSLKGNNGKLIQVEGSGSAKITIRSANLDFVESKVLIGDAVPEGAVTFADL